MKYALETGSPRSLRGPQQRTLSDSGSLRGSGTIKIQLIAFDVLNKRKRAQGVSYPGRSEREHHEECCETAMKPRRNSECSKNENFENFQYWIKFFVSYEQIHVVHSQKRTKKNHSSLQYPIAHASLQRKQKRFFSIKTGSLCLDVKTTVYIQWPRQS